MKLVKIMSLKKKPCIQYHLGSDLVIPLKGVVDHREVARCAGKKFMNTTALVNHTDGTFSLGHSPHQ